MIELHYLAGERHDRSGGQLELARATLAAELPALAAMPLEVTIALLAALAREIPRDPRLAAVEGAAYLALWLKRSNLERLCRLDYLADHRYERFSPVRPGVELRAYPRGIVGHWVAGNMPTLGVFSLALAMLSRNASLLKLPQTAVPSMLALLERLAGLEVQVAGVTRRGADLARGVAVVSFAGSDRAASEAMSRAVDVKLVWGDAEAVRTVTALPQQEHCEILSFGPKYAFGALDREAIASDRFDELLAAAARDVAAFSQRACSSPHVLFFERGALPLAEIANRLEAAFTALPARALAAPPDPRTASRIIEGRAVHLLDPVLDARVPADLSWSILVGGDPTLEEPIGGRTVWLKEVDSLAEASSLVTRRIQVVGIAIDDEAKRRSFAEEATARGADRIVGFGRMHDFELPWDGALALNRLVRWVVLAP